MNKLPFTMPPPRALGPAPVWDGDSFVIGDRRERVLSYDTGASGWTEDLTQLHEEETAGGAHFIDIASRLRALDTLAHFLPEQREPVILEVGVSGGHFLRDLGNAYPKAVIVGADYTRGTLERIADRFPQIPLVQLDLTRSSLPDSAFDAIVLLNVLEHIERDDLAVAHCFRMLRPGGILVIEVPAGPGLYDAYDEELMHFRRYARGDLTALLHRAGFKIEEVSHIGFLLYPPFWLSKKRSRLGPKPKGTNASRVRQAIKDTSRFDGAGSFLMAVEARIARKIALPFGIRCTAVARKVGVDATEGTDPV